METITVLQIIWFMLVGILFAGYAVLDGFDLGAGALLPFLAGNDEKQIEQVFKTVGPVWDGNEVWLVTAGGALFAAFPDAYATVFSGFYLALMLVLLGLILRAVSIEFFILEPEKKKIWGITFFAGSIIPSLLFGVALGNVIAGVPLNASMEFTGSFLTLLRPFPLSIGLLGFSAILLQGSSYIALKTDGIMRDKARRIAEIVWRIHSVFFVIALVLSFLYLHERINTPGWIFAIAFILMMVMYRIYFTVDNDMKKFIFSSASFLSLWGIVAAVQFPVLVKASGESALDITIYNASSGTITLSVMMGIALIGMPFVIGYTIYVYRIFRGKIDL